MSRSKPTTKPRPKRAHKAAAEGPALPKAAASDTAADTSERASRPEWFVYLLGSDGGARTYVGISTDVDRRLAQHNGDAPGGAKSTRAGRPWRVLRVHGPYATRGRAQSVEAALKRVRGRRRLDYEPVAATATPSGEA